jgi:hypothetical protein
MATVEIVDRTEKPGIPAHSNSTAAKRSRQSTRALEIIDCALEGTVDEEFILDRASLRETGREIAVERHGEDFVADIEARLRAR